LKRVEALPDAPKQAFSVQDLTLFLFIRKVIRHRDVFEAFMARPRPTEFAYKKSAPFNGKEWRVFGYVDGQRKQYWFSTEKEAKKEVAERNFEAACGTLTLDTDTRFQASRAVQLLEPTGKGILDAVRFFLADWQRTTSSIPFSQLAAEIRTETKRRREADEISSSWAQSISSGLHQLELQYGNRIVSTITFKEAKMWLTNLPGAPRSKTNILRIARQVFATAIEDGYTTSNPFKAVKSFEARVSEENSKIHILSASETSRLLHAADPEVIPYLALWFFTGIRAATLGRLDWSEIKISEKIVIVPGYKGKNQKSYDVTISPNLLEWLQPYIRESGTLLTINRNEKADSRRTRKLIRIAAKRAGIELPDNVGRHTYISNHVKHYGSIDRTALEANTSVAKIKERYLHRVNPEDAAKFWAIRPPAPAPNIIQMTAAA
jgi:integrase